MSHRANGTRTYQCPFCKKPYLRSNYMLRPHARADDGTRLRDTHQIKCYRELSHARTSEAGAIVSVSSQGDTQEN